MCARRKGWGTYMDPSLYRMRVKQHARMLLAQNYGKLVGSMAIYTVITMLLNCLQIPFQPAAGADTAPEEMIVYFGVVCLISLATLLFAPIQLGVIDVYRKVAKNEPARVGDVFVWMGEGRRVWQAIKISLAVFVRTLGWALVYLGPVILVFLVLALVFGGMGQAMLAPFLTFYFIALAVVGVFYAARVNLYTPAIFLLAEDPLRPVNGCIREAVETMRPHKWEFFILSLSFIGWELLALFTCGFLMILYVTPYLYLSQIVFFEGLRAPAAPQPGDDALPGQDRGTDTRDPWER